MPYSITTKDGITIQNIPDNVDPNSDDLKQRVAKERATRDGTPTPQQAEIQKTMQEAQEPEQEDQGFVDAALGGLKHAASASLDSLQAVGKEIVGGAETAANFVTGAVAEPLAGISGLAHSAIGGQRAGLDAIKSVKEGFTYKPRTEEGKENLQAIGGALEPVGKALSKAERFLGEKTLEVTGMPELAAIAHSLPTAALEIIGFKGSKHLTKLKGPSDNLIKKTLIESAPEMEAIKSASRAIYKELDNSGVAIKSRSASRLVNSLDELANVEGLDVGITPRSFRAIERVKEAVSKGESIPTRKMDQLRKVAKNAISTTDAADARVGMAIVDEIDDFLDNIKAVDIDKGAKIGAQEVSKKYKTARKLWGRAKRSEMLTDAIEMGMSRKAGMEKGIRNELNNLLNRKKSRKFLSKEDVAAIRKVTDGDFKQNFSSMLGGLGIKFENSPSLFGGLVTGGAVGGLSGSLPLAVGTIAVGTVSRKIAEKMIKNSGEFLDATARAGNDSKKIVAAYLKTVPKKKRSVSDLSDLLADPNLDLKSLEMIANETVKDAVKAARFKRELIKAATALSVGQLPEEDIKLDFTISGGGSN